MKKNVAEKAARSKARIEARNKYKALAKTLQGISMVVTEEEVIAREKAEKRPIVPKRWKVKEKLRLEEARKLSPKVTAKDFYCEELKTRRAEKRKRLKDQSKDNIILQAPKYIHGNSDKQITAQAKFNMMILGMKKDKKLSERQSKEDKAKYKASLVAFKETYVRTNKVPKNDILAAKPRHKKNRKAGRKSTAKVYSIRKHKLAA